MARNGGERLCVTIWGKSLPDRGSQHWPQVRAEARRLQGSGEERLGGHRGGSKSWQDQAVSWENMGLTLMM